MKSDDPIERRQARAKRFENKRERKDVVEQERPRKSFAEPEGFFRGARVRRV